MAHYYIGNEKMKKLFILFNIIMLCSCKENKTNLKTIDYVNVEIVTDIQGFYTDIEDKNLNLSDVLEDLFILDYLLRINYAGYEDSLKDKYQFNTLIDRITDYIKENNSISQREFCEFLYNELIPFMSDAHSGICYKDFYKTLCKHKCLYFSNTYVKKCDDFYEIIESQEKELIGKKLRNISNDYLFYYPSKGKNIFRVGCLSYGFVSTISIEAVELSVYSVNDIVTKTPEFIFEETKENIYIKIPTFNLPPKNSIYRKTIEKGLEDFSKYPVLMNNSKNIVIDLRGNKGGLFSIIFNFITDLYFENETIIKRYLYKKEVLRNLTNNIEKLDSPNVDEAYKKAFDLFPEGVSKKEVKQNDKLYKEQMKSPYREWRKEKNKKGEGVNYKGSDKKIYLIIDKETSSAGEFICCLAEYLFSKNNVTIIGENSFGAIMYADQFMYALPNSKVIMLLPCKKNSKLIKTMTTSFKGEGIGIYPEYWSTNEDLNETIYFITHDDEMKEILKSVF